MRKSIGISLIFLCIVMILVAGCVGSSPVSSTTPTQPTLVPATAAISNDKNFLDETIKTSEEMAITLGIFNNAVDEMNAEYTGVQQAEYAYENAVADLQQEQEYLAALQSDYATALQRANPRDIATFRYLKSEYDSMIADENGLIVIATGRVSKYDAARKAAIHPIDFKAKGLDITILSTSSQKAIDQLTPLPVSTDLQPFKNQYLATLSSYKKAGDLFQTAVNYYNNGKISESATAIEQASINVQAGNNQLDLCKLKIQQYRNSLGI